MKTTLFDWTTSTLVPPLSKRNRVLRGNGLSDFTMDIEAALMIDGEQLLCALLPTIPNRQSLRASAAGSSFERPESSHALR